MTRKTTTSATISETCWGRCVHARTPRFPSSRKSTRFWPIRARGDTGHAAAPPVNDHAPHTRAHTEAHTKAPVTTPSPTARKWLQQDDFGCRGGDRRGGNCRIPGRLLSGGSSSPSTRQIESPFPRDNLSRVAVDSSGNVYVTDETSNQVLKLTAGSSTPTALPLTGLDHPASVAIDARGTVYVVDRLDDRVLQLAEGSGTPTALPVPAPAGVAVDSVGTVYVSAIPDQGPARVLKFSPGSTAATALPFTGVKPPLVWRSTTPVPCTSPTLAPIRS